MHIWLKNMVTLFDHVSKWKLTYSNTFLNPYFRFYIANIFKNWVREKSMGDFKLDSTGGHVHLKSLKKDPASFFVISTT